jgi:hypothetical protein
VVSFARASQRLVEATTAAQAEAATQLNMTEMSSAAMFKEWRKHSGKVRSALGFSSSFSGWTDQQGTSLHGFPVSDRAYDVLDCAWASQLKKYPQTTPAAEMKRDFWANASQAVQRKPWGPERTFTTRSVWYSFEKDTTLDGSDLLRLAGLPAQLDTSGLSDADLRDLAGESFSCPIITALCTSFYYLPWGKWWLQGSQ